ncbi:MAG: hypothetical protein WC563_15275 [Brevundimonas sp.]
MTIKNVSLQAREVCVDIDFEADDGLPAEDNLFFLRLDEAARLLAGLRVALDAACLFAPWADCIKCGAQWPRAKSCICAKCGGVLVPKHADELANEPDTNGAES